jgi:hypothetical protein
MTDDEKHEFCRERTGFGAVFLPPTIYEAAERAGYDMRFYVMQKSMPVTDSYRVSHEMPSSAEMRAASIARVKAGLPLGAMHVSAPYPTETFIAGSMVKMDDYGRVALPPVTARPGPKINHAKFGPSSMVKWDGCPGAKPEPPATGGKRK